MKGKFIIGNTPISPIFFFILNVSYVVKKTHMLPFNNKNCIVF